MRSAKEIDASKPAAAFSEPSLYLGWGCQALTPHACLVAILEANRAIPASKSGLNLALDHASGANDGQGGAGEVSLTWRIEPRAKKFLFIFRALVLRYAFAVL